MVSFYALSVQLSVSAGQLSCDRKYKEIGVKIWYRELLALHRIPAGILHAWNHC